MNALTDKQKNDLIQLIQIYGNKEYDLGVVLSIYCCKKTQDKALNNREKYLDKIINKILKMNKLTDYQKDDLIQIIQNYGNKEYQLGTYKYNFCNLEKLDKQTNDTSTYLDKLINSILKL